MKAEQLACWALTPQGAALARTLAARLGGLVYVPERMALPEEHGFTRLPEAVTSAWGRHRNHVFVAATGIVVRCIAPLLEDKTRDPAVVVCDQNGRFAISLLSGHLGHANTLAADVAASLGAQAVITTATDCAELPAFDVLAAAAHCAFADVGEVKAISAALLAGQTIVVRDPLRVLDHQALAVCPQCRFGDDAAMSADAAPPAGEVAVSLAELAPRTGLLRLHPRLVHVGVGCRRGTPAAAIERAVLSALHTADVTPRALASIASATIKEDEGGLREAASRLRLPVRFFAAEDLAALPVPHPSPRAAVALQVGRVGVCEAAALLAAGQNARLLLGKQIYDAHGAHLAPERAAQGDAGMITVAVACGSAVSTQCLMPGQSCPCPKDA